MDNNRNGYNYQDQGPYQGQYQQGQYAYNQQNQYQQPQYQSGYQYQQQPQYQYVPVGEQPLSVGQWVGTLLLMLIPVVNIVMLFVWAFGNGHKDRSNFAKAELIISIIIIAITVVLTILGVSLFSSLYYYL